MILFFKVLRKTVLKSVFTLHCSPAVFTFAIFTFTMSAFSHFRAHIRAMLSGTCMRFPQWWERSIFNFEQLHFFDFYWWRSQQLIVRAPVKQNWRTETPLYQLMDLDWKIQHSPIMENKNCVEYLFITLKEESFTQSEFCNFSNSTNREISILRKMPKAFISKRLFPRKIPKWCHSQKFFP